MIGWLQNRAEPALYTEGGLLPYFMGISGICGIGQGFRYTPWRKGFPHVYALLFTFSEAEIKTAQLVHIACRSYNFIVIFLKSQYFAVCNVLTFFIRQENCLFVKLTHIRERDAILL